MLDQDKITAGIELGGTKAIALIARGTQILAEFRTETTKPEIVLPAIKNWLLESRNEYDFQSIGIASFGPVGLNKNDENYGKILKTPKPYWSGADIVGHFASSFDLKINIDTDVNGAALAEYYWGAAIGKSSAIYITIGTGIGGGIVINGTPLHGFMHPEMGHMRIRRNFQTDYEGICPFHNDCLEGLASGPAIERRTGLKGNQIPNNHEIWRIIGDEIGEFLANLILVQSPEIILLGGGVMQTESDLLNHIRDAVAQKLGNYVAGLDRKALDQLIKKPALGDKAGPLGAIALGIL